MTYFFIMSLNAARLNLEIFTDVAPLTKDERPVHAKKASMCPDATSNSRYRIRKNFRGTRGYVITGPYPLAILTSPGFFEIVIAPHFMDTTKCDNLIRLGFVDRPLPNSQFGIDFLIVW